MRRFIFLIISVLPMFATDAIRFAPIPMENSVKTLKIFTPMVSYLEKLSGKKIDIIFKKNNNEIVDAFINGEVDLAYVGPLPFVDMINRYKEYYPVIQFLEKNGKSTYTCTMFAREEESPILKNIKNHTFALTMKYSTCGYAFAEEVLRDNDASMNNNSFKYIGSHHDAIIEVLTGSYDIGTAKTSIFNKHKHLGIKSIAISKDNPGLLLVANKKTLKEQDILKIQNIIINTPESVRKKWNDKINKAAVVPDIDQFLKYHDRVQDIKLQND